MPDIRVAVAPTSEHATLNQLYVRWGYHGGIAEPAVVYVARIDERPVGIVRRTVEHGALMLRGMQVAPEFHHQGVGTQLLRAFAADLPPGECYCVPFAHLTAFYGQIGFSVVDEPAAPEFLRERVRRYRSEGHDVLIMRRDATGDALTQLRREDLAAVTEAYLNHSRAPRQWGLVAAAIGGLALGPALISIGQRLRWPARLEPIFFIGGWAIMLSGAFIVMRRERAIRRSHEFRCPACDAVLLSGVRDAAGLARVERIVATGTCPGCATQILAP